jgi:hypothetical protein
MGYFRILRGINVLGIESKIIWATPGSYSIANYPCFEDGSNCKTATSQKYVDPYLDQMSIQRRIERSKMRNSQ